MEAQLRKLLWTARDTERLFPKRKTLTDPRVKHCRLKRKIKAAHKEYCEFQRAVKEKARVWGMSLFQRSIMASRLPSKE